MARTPHPLVAELIRVRSQMGLSQRQAAELTGIGRRTLQNWECGRYAPVMHALDVYARGLGYAVALTRTPPPPPEQVPDGHKRCRRCQDVKPRAEFYRDRANGDGLNSYCKTCNDRAMRAARDRREARKVNAA